MADLFGDERIDRLAEGLPKAFEMVSMEMPPGNPAIGILREHVLTGFFINEFQDEVKTVESGVERGLDLSVCGHPLSIKTVTKNGKVKLIWTVDTKMVNLELDNYQPDFDIFLVNIFWGREKDSIFYIPVSVQSDVHQAMQGDYLNSATGTNNRGIELSSRAMKHLKADGRTLRKAVDWRKTGIRYRAYDRWEHYWGQYD